MKRLSMLLIPCIAISANAATFNAQGKTINSNDAKNPGIVKFEKNTAVKAKNNKTKPAALARTYTPTWVQATSGVFDQRNRTYELNGESKTSKQYFDAIKDIEDNDNPRKYDLSSQYTDYGLRQLPNKGSYNYCKRKYNQNFINNNIYYSAATRQLQFTGDSQSLPYAIGYTEAMDEKEPYTGYSMRCWATGTSGAAYTCGKDIHIYNIVGDDPITFNGDFCSDSRRANYKEGIKHYYAIKFINYYAELANIHYFKDRTTTKFAQHPVKPYDRNMHIGNIISSPYKNQTSYGMEAAALDDYIYNNRVIEFAPYTHEGGRTGAGLALNAITVAGASGKWNFNANQTPNGNAIPGHITLEESLENPLLKQNNNSSKYQKPEIYNVSNGLFSSGTIIEHEDIQYEYEGITDAWGASTVSAAMTADLLERDAFYKWHPEVVKALWLSASGTRTDNNYGVTNIYNKKAQYTGSLATFDGLIKGNKSRYWYGNNTDFLVNNKITFTENVIPGTKYGFAIAWLVRGDYALYENNLSSNYTLTISYKLPSGSTKTHAQTKILPATYRAFKGISIPEGVYSVTVTIERIRDTGDRIVLGYNMHQSSYN